VHLRSDGLADPRAQQASDTDAVALLRSARNARRTLECGVTTIRDCGSRGGIDFALRTASQQALCPTPRLVLSGLIVCMTGGHGWQLGYEADGPDAVRRAARTQIKLGADNVKLIASGGILSPGSEIGAPQFTVEEMRAAVEEAHAAGKICCAHAHGATAIKNAVKAGVNSVEHGYLLDKASSSCSNAARIWSRPRPPSATSSSMARAPAFAQMWFARLSPPSTTTSPVSSAPTRPA
jgi:imidazolonepropionase-like amidohydrolase